MALDGMMLSMLRKEIFSELENARIDKIHQPVKEELIISLRSKSANRKLLICARAEAPRVHFTEISVENPKQPPMFCMLMRKWLSGAKLIDIRQPGLERVLLFDFETTNELGDTVTVTLAAEIMGRYSNIILVGPDGRIIDSVKRVGADKSSLRQILPGLTYKDPPPQTKTDLMTEGASAVIDAMQSSVRDVDSAKLLQEVLEGASPLLAREVAHRALGGISKIKSELTEANYSAFERELENMRSVLSNFDICPTMLVLNNTPKDFSFIDIGQYGSAMVVRHFQTLSSMLDAFYGEKDAADRMKQKMSDFSKLLAARIERVERKLCAQKEELLECKNRDKLRRYGDLLSANVYRLEKGMSSIVLEDYFEENCPEITIELDNRLTPQQNIQRYYKEYRRADTAEKMLKDMIAQGEQELLYLDSVYDLMNRARTETELANIRAELAEGGYIRALPQNGKKKQEKKLQPMRYRSSDGYLILSGRNNLQNDRLTLKESRGNDIWFHVQKNAGSHTILITEGTQPPNQTLFEAAVIAAYNSKARNSAKVPVDYTAIRNVKKQPGGKPGMVIYDNFSTAIVDPDEQLVNSLTEN